MKNSLFLFVLSFGFSALAQPDEVKEKFAYYQISVDLTIQNLKDAGAEYYFDLKSTTLNGTSTKVEVSHFDPALAVGNRWVLESVDGNLPAPADLKIFDSAYNTKKDDINGAVIESSFKIVRDDDTYLLVSFDYNKSSLPKKYAFLSDCNGLAYFNKKSKTLEKLHFLSSAPLIIKSREVFLLDMTVHCDWNDTAQAYFISSETMRMSVDLNGQVVVVEETNEYSNYSKL